MAKILCRTKGNASPKGKPRVYFTCHPEDFDRYFDRICGDIFSTHDCAVYYTEDMSAVIAQQDRATDLESNNLFVVPVTYRLLTRPNRAMDEDIPLALEKRIPVLPFMMEPGIDAFYAQPDKFGELQYLNPFSTDLTEISYAEKLKKYLDSVLISDEMARRVRAAFDAYIFLSYRKKDRRYANELMRLIHSHPECRDIAIWYDEFLTPGESFRENIEKILHDSKLFTLLVTPSLLEEPEGKPNFVMGEEYPAAKKSGVNILPAEMEETDKNALDKKFADIPSCVNPQDDAFKARLLESLSRVAISANNDDPTHNYLIGLAYLEGIDVEIDRQRGLELITSAAESDLPEAMVKLYDMYSTGTSVKLDYRKAAGWAERLVKYHENHDGGEHPETLHWMHNLAGTYGNLGEYKKGLEVNREVYAIRCRILGEEHPDTLSSLNNLAVEYGNLGDYNQAMKLKEQAYMLRCKVLGEEHPDTLTSMSNLVGAYGLLYERKKELEEQVYILRRKNLGEEHPDTLASLRNLAGAYVLDDHHKTLKLLKKAYTLQCKNLGEEHPDTLASLNGLGMIYGRMKDYKKALELNEKAYVLYCKVLGEEHPDTLKSLSALADTYQDLGDHHKSLDLRETVYTLRYQILGEEHPDMIQSLNNIAFSYGYLGEHAGGYEKVLAIQERVYAILCKILGEEHPSTVGFLNSMAVSYSNSGDHHKALELKEKGYTLLCKIRGEEHPHTIATLRTMAVIYEDLGDYHKALAVKEQVYALRCKTLGEEHPDTVNDLCNLAHTYFLLGNHKKTLELHKKAYAHRCKLLGEEHPDTLRSLNNLAIAYGKLGDRKKVLELKEKVYTLQCRVLGEKHPETDISLSNFAVTATVTHYKRGNARKSAPLLKKAVDLSMQILGPEHETTQKNLKYFNTFCRAYTLCSQCGGSEFRGLFRKKCSQCGAPKDN